LADVLDLWEDTIFLLYLVIWIFLDLNINSALKS
jgi:hypothetical protein